MKEENRLNERKDTWKRVLARCWPSFTEHIRITSPMFPDTLQHDNNMKKGAIGCAKSIGVDRANIPSLLIKNLQIYSAMVEQLLLLAYFSVLNECPSFEQLTDKIWRNFLSFLSIQVTRSLAGGTVIIVESVPRFESVSWKNSALKVSLGHRSTH